MISNEFTKLYVSNKPDTFLYLKEILKGNEGYEDGYHLLDPNICWMMKDEKYDGPDREPLSTIEIANSSGLLVITDEKIKFIDRYRISKTIHKFKPKE